MQGRYSREGEYLFTPCSFVQSTGVEADTEVQSGGGVVTMCDHHINDLFMFFTLFYFVSDVLLAVFLCV